MANERVSQLNELAAGNIAVDDVFLVTDTSARESKRVTADDLSKYVVNSASFTVDFATTADTASFIEPGNVGLISSSSYSISSSRAGSSANSDVATTASYASFADSVVGTISNSDTASFLSYTEGDNNGTASNARTASLAFTSTSSSFIVYTGAANGTSSYSMRSGYASDGSASYSVVAMTASYIDSATATVSTASYVATASSADFASASAASNTASFLQHFPGIANGTASHAVKATNSDTSSFSKGPQSSGCWAQIYWLSGYASPQITSSYNLSSITFLERLSTGQVSRRAIY